MKAKLIITLLIALVIAESSSPGVEVIDGESLAKLITEKPKVLLLFSDKEC